MFDFKNSIVQAVQKYQGSHQEIVAQAPFVYALLTNLLDDPELPGRLRPLVLVALAYFMLPADVISEDLTGGRGFLDDLFFAAIAADTIRQELGSGDILERSWEGPGTFMEMAAEILRQENELVGDRRDVILWFTGFEQLRSSLRAVE